ncbi:MAG: methanogenesis marker 17 protein [Candidatus Helarchaeota archaeon]
MSEKIFVENLDQSDPFNFGIISHKIIADYVFQDLALAGAIRSVRILIDIKKPLFYIDGELNIVKAPIHLSEIASIKLDQGRLRVVIENETYAPDLLKLLWTRYGRENITQLDRWTLLLPVTPYSIEDLNQWVVADPSHQILNKIMDALNRIIPEGFRVRQNYLEKEHITIIASENPLQPEWIRQAETALQHPPISIPPKYLEELKREPKYSEKRIVPWKTHEFQESVK